MRSTFPKPVFLVTSLASDHTMADGALVLQSGDGARLGTLASGQVFAVTAVNNPGPAETILANFRATGVSGDTLTGVTADVNSSDVTIASGASIQIRLTPAWLMDLQSAIRNLEVIPEVSITGAITLDDAAWGKDHVLSGTGPYTVVLPSAFGHAGDTIGIRADDDLVGMVTLDGNASETISGAATRLIFAQESCLLESDGANLKKQGGKSRTAGCTVGRATAQAMLWGTDNPVSFNGSPLYDNTGVMADLANHRIKIPRAGTYTCTLSGFAGNSDLADGSRILAYIYSNGTPFTPAELSVGTSRSNCALVTATGLQSFVAGDLITAHVLFVDGTATTDSVMSPVLEVREFDPW